MEKRHNIAIGIQARLGSSRFPRKILEKIGGKTILDYVLSACKFSSRYVNRHSDKTGIFTGVYLLVPHSDYHYHKHLRDVTVIVGDEDDVLSRYVTLQEKRDFDGIIRVTCDCPLIQPSIITKAATIGVRGGYDFVSNAMIKYRTFLDGFDCEYVSKQLLEWLDHNAKGSDREHVTYLLNKEYPKWAKMARMFSNIDLSNIKLSLDTDDDLRIIKEHINRVDYKMQEWINEHGPSSCHRFWST